MCVGCGNFFNTAVATEQDDQKLQQLSQKVHTNAVIWLVIGVLQVLSVACALIGIINILSAVNDMKYSKAVLNNPNGIVKRFEPLGGPIFTLAYNLILGGVIGVIGSIYYFVAIRGFVMENKAYFEQFDEQ